jgi:hypothetical protein
MAEYTENDEIRDLEYPCEECRGTGGYHLDAGWRNCANCQGAGYVPTTFGERILELVRHNLKPILQDTRDT